MCVVEEVKEVLRLTLENKNGVVPSGELTVILDGLNVDQEPLQNGNDTTTTSEYSSRLTFAAFYSQIILLLTYYLENSDELP